MRVQKDFFARPSQDQESICENTWCSACNEADAGLLNPTEDAEDNRVFVEGNCAKCGSKIVTEIEDRSGGG
jgi:hypothetical protein